MNDFLTDWFLDPVHEEVEEAGYPVRIFNIIDSEFQRIQSFMNENGAITVNNGDSFYTVVPQRNIESVKSFLNQQKEQGFFEKYSIDNYIIQAYDNDVTTFEQFSENIKDEIEETTEKIKNLDYTYISTLIVLVVGFFYFIKLIVQEVFKWLRG